MSVMQRKLKERSVSKTYIPNVLKRMGLTKGRRTVYHFIGIGYWVAPAGYRLVASKDHSVITLYNIMTPGIEGQVLWNDGEHIRVVKERFADAFLTLSGGEKVFNTLRRYANRQITKDKYFILDNSDDEQVTIMICGNKGKPVVYAKCRKESVPSKLEGAIALSNKRLEHLRVKQLATLEEVSEITPTCPTLVSV